MNLYEFDQPLDLRLKALNLTRTMHYEPMKYPSEQQHHTINQPLNLPPPPAPVPIPPPHQLNQNHNHHHHHNHHQPHHHNSMIMTKNPMMGAHYSPNTCLSFPPTPSGHIHLNNNNNLNDNQAQSCNNQSNGQPIMNPLYVSHYHSHSNRSHLHQQQSPVNGTRPHAVITPTTNFYHTHTHEPQHPILASVESAPGVDTYPIVGHEIQMRQTSLQCQASKDDQTSSQPNNSNGNSNSNNNISNRNNKGDSNSPALPITRQHSLVSRYYCKPCGIVFSQPETLRAHQEGYCTKRDRGQANQIRSKSAASPTVIQQSSNSGVAGFRDNNANK